MNRSLETTGPFILGNYFPPLKNLIIHILLVATAAWIGIQLVTKESHVAALWLANGITLGVLLTSPRRYWIVYPLCSLGANITVGLLSSVSPPLVIVLASASNIAEILVAASIVYRPDRPSHHFTDRASAVRMVLAFIAGPAVSVVLVALIRYWLLDKPIIETVQVYYIAHLMGLAIVTPLTLTVLFRDFDPIITRSQLPQTISVLALLTAITVYVFSQTHLPLLFLVFPFVALTVFRLGFAGMTISLFLVGIIVSYFTLAGSGPFMLVQGASPGERIMLAQFFIFTCIAMALPIAVALLERTRLERTLFAAQDQLRQLAATDQLTGLPNRRTFDEFMDREWKRALRDQTSLCAIMIDVDCFKLYNDQYGHQAGDECLKAVAQCLIDVVRRPGDLVVRYGGEEFVALLPATNLDGACFVAEQIRRRVENLQIVHSATTDGRVTVSLGVEMMVPDKDTSSEKLIAAADDLLYVAKERGRNCVCTVTAMTAAAPQKRASGQ